ncbi:hypothetical protein [Rhizobium sp. L9]|uniref:hypothetical protein n=1 Tax=Rhizobium sp. L9 TaxID=1340738 RepID=UPI0015968646|nr:hypothetical protein [Rhizobium sp. L9]
MVVAGGDETANRSVLQVWPGQRLGEDQVTGEAQADPAAFLGAATIQGPRAGFSKKSEQ